MTFIYTREHFKDRINAGIQNRIGMLSDADDFVNDVARQVITDIDIRSAVRRAALTPKLFNGIHEYTAPSDLKDQKIIDVPPQVKRGGEEWFLTTPADFYRKLGQLDGWMAIERYNGISQLLLAKNLDDENRIIAELDSLTSGGGTWALFGDAVNVAQDLDNYVKGAGSLKFDISGVGGTTAGIQNTALELYDIVDFIGGNGAVFAWAYLSSATDVTNFILRLGKDASNYISKTVTAQHDGTAFVAGWNLLRFDLVSYSTTGSPGTTDFDYAAIYMTKAAGKINETDFRFDWLVMKRGQIYNVKYHSKYPWISSAGAYKENSTADSDLLVADTTEYGLFLLKGKQMAAEEINEFDLAETYRLQYEGRDGNSGKRGMYLKMNPSESKVITDEYHKF